MNQTATTPQSFSLGLLHARLEVGHVCFLRRFRFRERWHVSRSGGATILTTHEANVHYNQSLFLQAAASNYPTLGRACVARFRLVAKPHLAEQSYVFPMAPQQLRKVTSGLECHICKYQIPMAHQVSRTSS